MIITEIPFDKFKTHGLYMNKKQYQFLNENSVPKNYIELFYGCLFEKFETLKINGQTIGCKIKVQALKCTS